MSGHLEVISRLKVASLIILLFLINACGGGGGSKADTKPNAFTFTAVQGALPNTAINSNSITVTSISEPVSISISGGQYSINNSDFTATAGTVSAGQSVKVQVTSSNTPSTAVSAVLTIGGVSATFTVTSVADTAPATAEIYFPTPVTASEDNSVLVRGTASAPYGVKSVTLMVNNSGSPVAATSDDGFANWQALVPLTDLSSPIVNTTENTISVSAENNAGVISANVAQVSVTQTARSASFSVTGVFPPRTDANVVTREVNGKQQVLMFGPDSGNARHLYTFDTETAELKIVSDETVLTSAKVFALLLGQDDNHLFIAYNSSPLELYSKDLTTGLTTKVYTFEILDISVGSLLWNPIRNKFVAKSSNDNYVSYGTVVEINEDFSNEKIFSDALTSVPSADDYKPEGLLTFDESHNRYLAAEGFGEEAIIAIDATTGERSIFSSNSVGDGDLFTDGLWAIDIDEVNQTAIVSDYSEGNIYSVDLNTGNRHLIVEMSRGLAKNGVRQLNSIVIDEEKSLGYCFGYSERIVVVDLKTGATILLVKGAST